MSSPSATPQESAKTLNSMSSSLDSGFHMWKLRGEQPPSARQTSPSKQWSDLKQLSLFPLLYAEKQIPLAVLLLSRTMLPSRLLFQPPNGRHCVPVGQSLPDTEQGGVALHRGSHVLPQDSGNILVSELLALAGGYTAALESA